LNEYVDDAGHLTSVGELSYLRFVAGAKTIDEVLAGTGPDWLIEGWLATSATMVTGAPESGKSTLVASMAASVVSGNPLLGSEVKTDRPGPVLVIASDPSDISQWAKKGHSLGVPSGSWELITFDRTRWDAYEILAAESQAKLVVFDNITSALEEGVNEANPQAILAPLTRILNAGTPVVVIHHSGKGGSKDPMGPTAYQAWRRHGVHISGKGEHRTLTRSSNLGAWNAVSIRGSEVGAAVRFELDEDGSGKRNRSPLRLDKNAEIAQWVVANCQHVSLNQTAKRIADEFRLTEQTRRQHLMNGPLSKLLTRSGKGGGTVWTLSK
jgi:hypothetical protein